MLKAKGVWVLKNFFVANVLKKIFYNFAYNIGKQYNEVCAIGKLSIEPGSHM